MGNRNFAPPSCSVPSEVSAFAARQGVLQILPAVLEMTQATFPACALTVSLGQDAEEETHRYIALDVAVGDLELEAILSAQAAWLAGLRTICSSHQTVWFVLGWL